MDRYQIKETRKRWGQSQKEFAAELDLHFRTIQEYEYGHLPVPRVVELALRQIESVKLAEHDYQVEHGTSDSPAP